MKTNTSSKSKSASTHPTHSTHAHASTITPIPPPFPIPPVTRQTLDSLPARALKLLRAVGINLPIRAALEHRGFTESDRVEGWNLLKRASEYTKEPALVFGQYDAGVQAAIAALDAWDEGGFAIIRATLERRFPEQAAMVLDGLSASTGANAVLGVGRLLDRLDQLAASHDKTDKAALALLGERGITAAERKQLRAYVETAQSGGTVEAGPSEDAAEAEAADAEQVQALMALRGWYQEWSAVARASIRRRDQLILLGLAKAKRRDANAAPTGNAPTPVTTPTTPASSGANAGTTAVAAPTAAMVSN